MFKACYKNFNILLKMCGLGEKRGILERLFSRSDRLNLREVAKTKQKNSATCGDLTYVS